MGHKIAEQIPRSENYPTDEVESYHVPTLENTEELSGLLFKLPYTPSRFDSDQPILCVYGVEDLTGYFFKGSSFQQNTLFGLEGPEESQSLDSGDYPAWEIAPFLGRYDSLGDGFRHYEIPVNNTYGHEVIAEIKPDERREQESVLLKSFEDDNLISQVLIGRDSENWDFMSAKTHEIPEEIN